MSMDLSRNGLGISVVEVEGLVLVVLCQWGVTIHRSITQRLAKVSPVQ